MTAPAAAQFAPPPGGGGGDPFAITSTNPADGASTQDLTPTITVKGNKEMGLTALTIGGHAVDLQEFTDCGWDGVEGTCVVNVQKALCPGEHTAHVEAETVVFKDFGEVPETDSATWSFTIKGDACNPGDARPVRRDPTPPDVTHTTPQGVTALERPHIEARFNDDVGVTHAGASMRLDGAPVDATLDVGALRYQPEEPLAPGEHEVTVRLENVAGNVTRHAWTFTVNPLVSSPDATTACPIPPAVDNPVDDPGAHGGYPAAHAPPRIVTWGPEGAVATARPTVSAGYLDAAGVYWHGARLTIDGAAAPDDAVEHTPQRVVYRPAANLTPGEHAAKLTVTNANGHTATHAWTFTVDPHCGATAPSTVAVPPAPPILLGGEAEQGPSGNLTVTTAALDAAPPRLPPLGDALVGVARVNLTPADAVEAVRLRLNATGDRLLVLRAHDDAWRLLPSEAAGGALTAEWTRGPVNALTVAVVRDTTPPTISDLSPGDGDVTNRPAQVAILTDDNVPAPLTAEFTINGDAAPAAPLSPGFQTDAGHLAQGRNDVEATVRDAAGNAATVQWSFTYDTVPPRISLDANATPPTARVTDAVSGVDAATLTVTLDGAPLNVTLGDDGAIHLAALPGLGPGDHDLRVAVRDHAGNPARANDAFTVAEDDAPLPAAAWTALAALLAALAWRRGRPGC